MTSTDIAQSNTGLDELATRIKRRHQAVRDAAKNIVQQAIAAGMALNDAKSKLAHGEWLPWVEQNCGFSERTAHNYMLLAANRGKFAIDADLTLTQALRQIRNDGGSGSKDDGPASRYDRAHAALIKKLAKLLPEDVEDAAKRTIAELEAAVAAIKRPV
jgi:hypothetical protein